MTEHTTTIDDKHMRLMAMSMGFIAIWDGMVNLDDLMYMRPGGIVRCRDKPADCISIFHPDLSSVGCVAGWISDEE